MSIPFLSDIDMNQNTVDNLKTPISDNSAATKKYVDDKINNDIEKLEEKVDNNDTAINEKVDLLNSEINDKFVDLEEKFINKVIPDAISDSIVDNLNTIDSSKALSAKQGHSLDVRVKYLESQSGGGAESGISNVRIEGSSLINLFDSGIPEIEDVIELLGGVEIVDLLFSDIETGKQIIIMNSSDSSIDYSFLCNSNSISTISDLSVITINFYLAPNLDKMYTFELNKQNGGYISANLTVENVGSSLFSNIKLKLNDIMSAATSTDTSKYEQMLLALGGNKITKQILADIKDGKQFILIDSFSENGNNTTRISFTEFTQYTDDSNEYAIGFFYSDSKTYNLHLSNLTERQIEFTIEIISSGGGSSGESGVSEFIFSAEDIRNASNIDSMEQALGGNANILKLMDDLDSNKLFRVINFDPNFNNTNNIINSISCNQYIHLSKLVYDIIIEYEYHQPYISEEEPYGEFVCILELIVSRETPGALVNYYYNEHLVEKSSIKCEYDEETYTLYITSN